MNIRVKLTKSANYNHYNVSSGSVIQLDLEEYLRGVVPSECYTTWSQNTLKAQAVAARSYAIVHPGTIMWMIRLIINLSISPTRLRPQLKL